MAKLAAALLTLAVNFYVYHWFATNDVIPPREPLGAFPTVMGEWHCEPEQMAEEVEKNLGVTDYLICAFQKETTRDMVGVYVGYHATQVRREGGGSGENMIHPPAHCLPGSGWDIIASRKVLLDLPELPGAPARVNRLIIAKGEERQLVYYWYQERGRVIAEDWRKILDLFWDRATRQRTDGALVRFTSPILRDGEARAEETVLELAGELTRRLPRFVPN
jgi:EpsI family protein